jgi:hypothetical protein
VAGGQNNVILTASAMETATSTRQADKFALICSLCFWAMVALQNTDVFYHLPQALTGTVLVLGFASAAVNLVWLILVVWQKRVKTAGTQLRLVLAIQFVTFLVQVVYFVVLFHRS